MRSRAGAALAGYIAAMILAAGCTSVERPTLESVPETSPTVSPTVAPDVGAPATSPPTPAEVPLDERTRRMCSAGNPEVAGFIDNGDVVEASGLAKATTHDGYWTLNDGNDPRLFAIGPKGEDLGVVGIAGVQLWDLEDLARWDHDGRTQLVMADIGDNTRTRGATHPLVIADEPMPGDDTASARTVFIEYPDGAHNAEALLIDAEANEVVVITKEEDPDVDALPPAHVYAGNLDGADVYGATIPLRLVGSIDIEALRASSSDTRFHPGELSGVAGLVTAADVSPDGRLVAMRTYGSVWVWARPLGATVADTLLTPPCEAEPPFELQGEAIAFADNTRWATLAEGSFASLRLSPPS